MGFIRDIRKILAMLPPRRQNLMFSATFADDVRQLAATFLHDPAQVQIARRNAPIELVRQVVYPVDRHRKRELLSYLIRSGRIDRALVFTRTKHGANRLAEQLDHDGIDAAAIHGNKSQGQRVRALDDFKEGRAAILVATEVAARGLDIDGLPHVVNYELPSVPEDYVHRIGRTGRAGLEGDAISLVCVDEVELLHDIEALLRQRIPQELVAGFEPDRTIRAEPIREIRRGNRPSTPRQAPHRSTSTRRMDGPRTDGRRPDPRRTERPRPSGRGLAGSRHGGARPALPGVARTAGGAPPPGGRDQAPRREGAPGSFVVMPGERFARADASS
jgi:ATP-dependent RNA helicase RhlE